MVNRALGIAALSCFALPMAAIVMIIYLLDGGGVIFRQERLGKDRRPFCCLKFRTMRDSGVTLPGRWLRRTGLDELPQLLNIIRGEMAAVGPRAITPADAERFGYLMPQPSTRWQVAPGMTGLAQLWGTYTPAEARELDEWYVQNRSFFLDARLVLYTLVANIFGKRYVQPWLRTRHTNPQTDNEAIDSAH